ncbi:MAG: hypothetical protein KKA55_08195 [Proteobacteria bacterium]|nr:hypothetical protein [Pseudomonadota bacterium]MBU1595496.1 hypothetical protein [Pseudomonadota bacterium]
MPLRNIYAQGDFDGACFLYSTVNAYVALQRETPDFEAICKAVAQVDHPGDFLNGTVGTTGSYDNNYALLEKNIRAILANLGNAEFLVQRIAGQSSPQRMEELVGPNSVAIVRYTGSSDNSSDMDHWVCVVECDRGDAGMHVACSVRLHKALDGLGCAYAERFHEGYGRWSNDILSERQEYTLVAGEVFQISIQP